MSLINNAKADLGKPSGVGVAGLKTSQTLQKVIQENIRDKMRDIIDHLTIRR